MKISIARLFRYAAIPLVWVSVAGLDQPLGAQTTDDRDVVRLNRRLRSLIRSIDDIKWSNITIYRLEDEFASRLIRAMENEDSVEIAAVNQIGEVIYPDEPLADFFNAIRSIAGQPRTNPIRNYDAFKRALAARYNAEPDDLDDTELKNAAGRVMTVMSKRASRPKQFYLVSSRDRENPRLISLLGVSVDEVSGKVNLSDNYVFVGTEVYNYLRGNGQDTAMYAELKNAINESSPSLSNQMFVLRDLSEISLAPTTKVRANYLDETRFAYVLTSISEGRPIRGQAKIESDSGAAEGEDLDLGGGGLFGDASATNNRGRMGQAEVPGTGEYPYELSVGTDVIASFRAYNLIDGKVPDPAWGVELRNNFDELNYPSIWGGRMTLNVLLENIRVGAVLPQIRYGGGTLDSSGIGDRSQKLLGGYGLAISGDFTAPVLNNSGLFNFYASYTFSEQKTDKIRPFFYSDIAGGPQTGDSPYLIRYAFQAFYSFGFYLDAAATHMFRLKFGGGVYGADRYIREEDTLATAEATEELTEIPTVFTKSGTENIGSVAARLEYMKGGQRIPYGLGVQYFDQSVLANLWVQFIISSRLDLKVEGKYFSPVFRDPHPWEHENLVVPSVSLKYHFGL